MYQIWFYFDYHLQAVEVPFVTRQDVAAAQELWDLLSSKYTMKSTRP